MHMSRSDCIYAYEQIRLYFDFKNFIVSKVRFSVIYHCIFTYCLLKWNGRTFDCWCYDELFYQLRKHPISYSAL